MGCPTPGSESRFRRGRLLIRAILALAAAKVAAGLAGIAVGWSLGTGGVEHPLPLWVFLLQIAAFTSAAAFLVAGARGDRRPFYLGGVFLLIASSYSLGPIQILDEWAGRPAAIEMLRSLQVDAFLPCFLWLFFREFPRGFSSPTVRAVGRLGVAVSLAVGIALFAANAALIATGDRWPLLLRFAASRSTSDYWAVIYVLMILGLPFAFWRARTARIEEKRRVILFVAGSAAGALPVSAFILLFAVSPGFAHWARSPGVFPILMPIIQLLILSIPIATAYSVLVDRVLDVRLIVRKALQYLAARALVGAVASVPFLWLGWYLFRLRGETLVGLSAGYRPAILAGALAVGLTGLRLRRRAISGIDRLFFREQFDSRQLLVGLVERSRTAASAEELARLLTTEIDRALHLDSIRVLVADPFYVRLRAVGGGVRPLDISSQLAVYLGEVGEPVRVDLEAPASPLHSLPEEDRQWLADGDVRLLVPLLSSQRELIGVIAFGGKRSELTFSREDRQLLAAIGASGALTLENRLLRDASTGPARAPADSAGDGALERAFARECVQCHVVEPPDAVSCPHCGGAVAPTTIPYLVLGKFRLLARVGQGGMGVVYRALDVGLHRTVAIKTLPRTSPEDSMRLRREARAMAAIVHPSLSLIYGAETWRGTPMLIIEFLEGGTLADRLAKAPLVPMQAVHLGATLSEVLHCVHSAGILHRDIKPSNIGFTKTGIPKLLDFGLARMLGDRGGSQPPLAELAEEAASTSLLGTEGIVGTPLYMSPEAISNAAPDASFDLWSLAVVLFEAIAGRNPVERTTWSATCDAIAHARIPDVREFAPDCPEPLALLLADCLSASRARRPGDARELGERLAEVAAEAA